MQPHIAFEHLRSDRCPGAPCVVPSAAAQYGAAIRRFVAPFPQVKTYTTWNEANHVSQPVSGRPEAVAGYYDQLRVACPDCTIVAGDVLDSGGYVRWLQRFLDASSTAPQLWGLHDYGDVTYGRTSGADDVLATVPGALWIEETGGLVSLRNAAGRLTFATTEARAAVAIDRAFAIAADRPRITRMYIYQWMAGPLDRFDSGLARPDGTLRPSYQALVADLAAARGAAPASTAGTSTAKVRWSVTWSGRRRLLLRATCPATITRCRGRVTVALRAGTTTRRLATRAYRTTTAHRTTTLRIAVSARAAQAARRARTRRVVLSVAPTMPAGAKSTTRLKLARPR
jgi:hypothetical protein